MKGKFLMATVALATSLMCLAGCGGGEAAFALPHFDGVEEDGSFDTDLFYKNDFSLSSGDTGVLYVSEEQGGEEYGGYYYQYCNIGLAPTYAFYDGEEVLTILTCMRSRDLYDWELCGVVEDGYCVVLPDGSWPASHFWAPEVVYSPKDQKYFMYFSAATDIYPSGDVEYDTGLSIYHNRFFAAVCVSDTPAGPFRLVTSENYYGDATKPNLNGKILTEENPQINFKRDNGLDELFPVLDMNPFFDDVDSDGDGQNDFYLYFSVVMMDESGTGTSNGQSIWGMKMKDMVTPDYSSARMLMMPNYRSVKYKGGEGGNFDLDSYELCGKFSDTVLGADAAGDVVDITEYGDESPLNEAPNMWKKDGRYFLTYCGVYAGNIRYQPRQAIGDSPLGEITKLPLYPGTIMGANTMNTKILGNGHHCLVADTDGSLFCVQWPLPTPLGDSVDRTGRNYAVDRIHFYNDPTYGLLMCGGPTTSLQPKPYSYTGLSNVATKAKVSASNAEKNTLRYLNDELVVFHSYFENYEFVSKGETTITLTFAEPVSVSAILIYNSYDYKYAFSEIDSILFSLAEKPEWYRGETYVPKAVIENLPFNPEYIATDTKSMEQGGAAVASFNEMKVNQIEITISQKLDNQNAKIKVSDIVVLGR